MGQPCSVGVVALGSTASAGGNGDGSVERAEPGSVSILESATASGPWDCGCQSASG